MTSFEQQIRASLAEMADATPVASPPQFDADRSSASDHDTANSHRSRGIMIAASVALVVAGVIAIALVGLRGRQEPADTPWSLTVEPNVVEPGDLVTLTGDTRWGWEAFLDQGDGESRERIWMMYPTSDAALTPRAPVDLRKDPNAGLTAARAMNPANNFQIPRRVEPGDYQICRLALTAEVELCADLTVVDPSNAP